jgi:oxygen-independent coproporphyrinogen III oxidase
MGVRHLYVHLPFCSSRCGYCAFVVEVGSLDRRDEYLDALLGEFAAESGRIDALDTVYLGGGTPTLMEPHRLATLMQEIRPYLATGAEVTIEANPETVDHAAFEALRSSGITRVSLGAQSFQPQLLDALDRRATSEQVRAAFHAARSAGFDSVSIDLLFAVPGQNIAMLTADIDEAVALKADHISWYELEVKPGSTLARQGAVVDEDFSEEAYRLVVERLEAAGFHWYETANFAQPGHECRHSLAYWQAADYVGVGIGAVSTVDARRWRNAPDLAGYIARMGAGETPRRTREDLDADTRRRERWMLGLRLNRPFRMDAAGPPDHPDALAHLAELGLISYDEHELRLSRDGRFVQNAILCELMEYAA